MDSAPATVLCVETKRYSTTTVLERDSIMNHIESTNSQHVSSASIRKLTEAGYVTKSDRSILDLPPVVKSWNEGKSRFCIGNDIRPLYTSYGTPGPITDALCVHLAPGSTNVPSGNDPRTFIGSTAGIMAPKDSWTASWNVSEDNADSLIGMPIFGNIAGFVIPKHVGVIAGWKLMPDGGKCFHIVNDQMLRWYVGGGFRIAPPRGNVWSMLSDSIPAV